jgi:Protein of unknown function (DUF1579)
MDTESQNEHQWLQKFVGEWIYETEAMMGADQPPEKSTLPTTSFRLVAQVH